MRIEESLISFGATGSLHGLLTEPPVDARAPGAPAMLLWNVGLHHHVGPYRIYVDLARRLAEAGYTCLRFDTSGLGDSETSRNDSRSDSERNVADVQEAMSAVARERGIERAVLVGFCSSVDAAHAAGLRDPRVAGIVYLEGYGYRTNRFYLHYALRLLDRHRWERRLRLKFPKLFREPEAVVDQTLDRERIFIRDYPTEHKLSRDMRKLVARGVRQLWVYGGGDTVYLYRSQFFDFIRAHELADKIDIAFFPSADHTFFLVEDRVRVIDHLVQWMRQAFPARAAA
jgi:pimeloyl-ACP methyl ester carboxylesterase